MSKAVWYCPLCFLEGTSADVTHCPEDGCTVRNIADREAEWIGKIIDEKYKVIRFIGAGGMADVFEAERISTQKRLALKLLRAVFTSDANLSERFRQEAMMISLIAHRNIVSLEDFGVLPNKTNYMVMELLSGCDLGTAIQKGPISPATAFRIALQACEGMAAAHERGVIHRDLKPDNIFLHNDSAKEEPVVKILDLGIGKLFNNNTPKGLTLSGTVVGTPEYMSPEQCQGKPADVPSDIYSMGMVLYEMLFGHVPFEDESALLILPRQISELPSWDDKVAHAMGIPPEAKVVVLRALAKNPKDRQQSMLDLQADVAGLLSRTRHGGRYSLPSPNVVNAGNAVETISTPPVHNTPTIAFANTSPYIEVSDDAPDSPLPIEIVSNVYWVGRRHNTQLECNPYLRVFSGNDHQISILFDPGPLRDLAEVSQKVGSIIDSIDNLNYIFLNHQDPDVAGNAAEIQRRNPRVLIICAEDTWRLARHYGLDPKRYISTESIPGGQIGFSTGHFLQFIPTPFCHERGAVMVYDPDAQILFSGDLFGGTSTRKGFLYTPQDKDGIHLFHQIYMPSKRALKRAIAEIEKLEPSPRIIAPQHGTIVMDEGVQSLIDSLRELNVGMDLIEGNEQEPEMLHMANEILRVFEHIAGKKSAKKLIARFREEQNLVTLFDVREPGQIVKFKVESAVAIATLLSEAEKTLNEDLRKQFHRSMKPIRNRLMSRNLFH